MWIRSYLIKSLFFLLFALAICGVVFPRAVFATPKDGNKEQHKITVFAVNYPPYSNEFPSKNGLPGFDVETVVAAFERVDIKATVEYMPWSRILIRAKQGKIAAVLSCAKAASRDSYLYFSAPISNATSSYIAKQSYTGKIPRSLLDGKNKKITAVEGYAASTELKKIGIPHHAVTNDDAALNMLLKRDFDFFYSNREFIEYIAVSKDLTSQLKYFDLKQKNFHLCFSQKWPDAKILLEQFNKGLSIIKDDGTYDRIHAKYK